VSGSTVRHNEANHRFEAGSDDQPARLDYRMRGAVVEMVNTEVPPEYQGQGLAGKLATAALDWARAGGHKVLPSCSYVKSFIDKHPEYQDLL
jgi:predicted GNAT family acetyltransferase